MNLADLPAHLMLDDTPTPLPGARRHDLPRRIDGDAAATPPPAPPGLCESIDRHLGLARRSHQPLALLAITVRRCDGDDGQPAPGLVDALAVELGHRLRARVRAVDTVLWQRGCDHVVLLQGCRPAAADAAQRRLRAALGGTYRLGPLRAQVQVAIGCACHPAAGDTGRTLLAAALQARQADG